MRSPTHWMSGWARRLQRHALRLIQVLSKNQFLAIGYSELAPSILSDVGS